MNYTSFSSFGPGKTPLIIKRLIICTSFVAIASAGIQSLLYQFGVSWGPQNFLNLSWWGLDRTYLWQPLSFLFVQEAPFGLSFSFFIALFFNMYLLWVIGTSLLETLGKRSFLGLYFVSGIAAGLIALLSMPLTGQYREIAGATPAILALLTVWSLAFAEAEVFLFFLIPLKAKWIVASIVGIILLTTLSRWDLTSLILYISAIAIGYGYATIVWGWHSPFAITQLLDRRLAQFGLYLRRHLFKSRSAKKEGEKKEGKIIDLGTGKPLNDDDAFVDAMLAKISKHGESSLSWSEKRRLQQISEKKMKSK